MRKITCFLPFYVTALMANAQTKNITGTWQGKLNAGVEIRLVFNFNQAADGTYTGTMDSPDQHIKGVGLSKVALNGDTLTVELSAAHAVYKAVAADSGFAGTWQQGPASLPLFIKKATTDADIAEKVRPQTPLPPFSYNSDSVEYDNADKTIRFGATFTYPKTGGPFATLILITGSGAQDRDETILGHKPFAVLADYLTKKGYAVLRVDDRGIGKTTGTMANATSADFAKDVEASLAYIKTRSEADKSKLGLLGHSEGGVIAPMVAAENKDIDFIILWGGPMAGGLKINTEQNGLALQNAGIDTAAVAAFKQLHAAALALFGRSSNVTELNASLEKVFAAWRLQQPPAILTALNATDSSIIGKDVKTIYDGLYNLPWMRYFIMHDFAADLARVHCKVLAINGMLDKQVDATTNLGVIDSVLKKNKNRAYTITPLPGLNHLLQTAGTGDVQEYAQIDETIAPQALATIGDWLDVNVKGKK